MGWRACPGCFHRNTNIFVILLVLFVILLLLLFVNSLLKQQSTHVPVMKAVISHEKYVRWKFSDGLGDLVKIERILLKKG
jgi:hypothetical protein